MPQSESDYCWLELESDARFHTPCLKHVYTFEVYNTTDARKEKKDAA